jgi:hypothetical protein
MTAGLTAKDFDPRLGLRYQRIFLERFNPAVLRGLEAAIIRLGSRREDFNNQCRVE